MAQKRMFSLSVVDTDKFLEMPISARLLYYELGMRADDDGFVSNWKKILLFTGLKEDDLKILIMKNFIIPFESGVIVIRHWRMNNYLQNDRTKPTIYQEELKELNLDNNNVYNLYTECIHSIDKNSIDKNSIDIYNYSSTKKSENLTNEEKQECSANKTTTKFKKPTIEEVQNYCKERNNNINAESFIDYYEDNLEETEQKPNNNLDKTQQKPKQNLNDNVDVDVDVNVNDNDNIDNKPTKKTNKKFVPPTLEEIENYCKEKNYNIDTQFFYEYFTEGNWVDSKGNKVKNWKQKIITWSKGKKTENKPIKNEWFDKNIKKEELSPEEEEEMKSILNKY